MPRSRSPLTDLFDHHGDQLGAAGLPTDDASPAADGPAAAAARVAAERLAAGAISATPAGGLEDCFFAAGQEEGHSRLSRREVGRGRRGIANPRRQEAAAKPPVRSKRPAAPVTRRRNSLRGTSVSPHDGTGLPQLLRSAEPLMLSRRRLSLKAVPDVSIPHQQGKHRRPHPQCRRSGLPCLPFHCNRYNATLGHDPYRRMKTDNRFGLRLRLS